MKNKRLDMRLKIFFIALTLAVAAPVGVFAQMTDQQVLNYVKDGIREGKEQKQMAAELARRGVTREQAERVQRMYEHQTHTNVPSMQGTDRNEARLRAETANETTEILDEQPTVQELAQEERVFGRNIFNTRNLTFEPNNNMATPPNYRLGPGDEVIIDIWGASQNTIRQTISPDGTINLQELGPVYLSGLSVREAEKYLQSQLGKLYSNENNQIKVTLGNSRTIQVNIMGEVIQPGTYALSAFSTVLHALYRAGGVNPIGSLRAVRLVRGGKTIATVDVYDFILNGKIQDDISLQEGDVIIVPAYEMLVKISGNVKRNMKFEMKSGETLADLVSYSGGFDADAYSESLRIVRQNGEEYEVKTVGRGDFASTDLKDGDVVTVGAILNRFTNKVEIKGAVYRPDIYELGGRIKTVRQLIEQANGLMDDAFTTRAVLQRQRDDMTREVVPVDIRGIMAGTAADVTLRKNDILYIPSIHDLREFGDITVRGEVAQPGNYTYADNMTLEDIIIQAGGLREAASTARIDVARRIKNPSSTNDSDTIGETYTFSLKDGFVISGEPGFLLQPYDQVYVRRSPGYQVQQNVSITGEVVFEGSYAMTSRHERISDLVQKSGGLTASAYARGARLTRIASPEERRRMANVVQMFERELGAGAVDSLGLRVDLTYPIGIDLEAALASPGGDADLVLREGDVLSVPKYNNTVKISGEVMMPNTVFYNSSATIKDYINQAGGYGQNAKKSKAFIVYMNGTMAKVRGNASTQIEPGCEIIVPMRRKVDGNRIWTQILGSSTTLASLGMMIASIATLTR